jgi:hypothetical protein
MKRRRFEFVKKTRKRLDDQLKSNVRKRRKRILLKRIFKKKKK